MPTSQPHDQGNFEKNCKPYKKCSSGKFGEDGEAVKIEAEKQGKSVKETIDRSRIVSNEERKKNCLRRKLERGEVGEYFPFWGEISFSRPVQRQRENLKKLRSIRRSGSRLEYKRCGAGESDKNLIRRREEQKEKTSFSQGKAANIFSADLPLSLSENKSCCFQKSASFTHNGCSKALNVRYL